jgi:hypothetical protein
MNAGQRNKMKIGILGSGVVAKSLARGFLAHGHEAMLGTRDRAKLEDWVGENPKGAIGSFADAAKFGELLVLAVKGTAAADALRAAGTDNFAGKPIVDTTNPIADAPPANGVLKFFTNLDDSLMERLQREFSERISSRLSIRLVMPGWWIRSTKAGNRRCSSVAMIRRQRGR